MYPHSQQKTLRTFSSSVISCERVKGQLQNKWVGCPKSCLQILLLCFLLLESFEFAEKHTQDQAHPGGCIKEFTGETFPALCFHILHWFETFLLRFLVNTCTEGPQRDGSIQTEPQHWPQLFCIISLRLETDFLLPAGFFPSAGGQSAPLFVFCHSTKSSCPLFLRYRTRLGERTPSTRRRGRRAGGKEVDMDSQGWCRPHEC